ncbi:MAG: 2-oxoacid:acceptor oxidoreductase family protein [Candidatus Bathyarchaeota archaeon]|jgi:pyruvate ferredoxin oxidoreductase gamma subunit|nr:2-oxoacid:acceptor oxidoreductase family protein [Candidatus Bathyarchaeota archaeon]MDP7443638.1 2-oxoacid:acceptor oxidoreductase family protein [Candidatus Bathyarchaeota archaeon]|tara:strand:- start:5150 stop:5971 length:822 start_codon:yes stop_codon:yes gene_type:complete
MMLGIRIHGRGGQGAVTASRLLADASYRDGKFSQAIPMYGTERRGAPLVAFVRIDDIRVRERELVHEPDIVIVLDPLLSKEQSVASGIKKGGLLIVNSHLPPEKVPIAGDIRIASVDATKIALETLKRPITNTAILGAFSKVVGFPSMESIETSIHNQFPGRIGEMNIVAIRQSYSEASLPVQATHKEAELDAPEVGVPGYGVLKDVSSWRVFTPIIDLDQCTGCKACWLFCPETAIKWENLLPEIEYRKCKGCGICVEECNVKCISFERVLV